MTHSSLHNPAARPRDTVSFTRKGFSSARAVGSFLPALTTKALQRYGFSTAGLILDWSSIVGSEIARYSAPEKLSWPRRAETQEEDGAGPKAPRSGAVLVLRVEPAKALDVQYRASHIIERINTYFGYAAVSQLRLIQASVPRAPTKPAARSVSEPLTREVAGIADPGLRDALARLGAQIMTGR
jgi:hypothetical protein